jgi:hypothetical protein
MNRIFNNNLPQPLWDYDKELPFTNLSRLFDLGTSCNFKLVKRHGSYRCMSSLCTMLRGRKICFAFGSTISNIVLMETNGNLFDLSRPLVFMALGTPLFDGQHNAIPSIPNTQSHLRRHVNITSNRIYTIPKAFKFQCKVELIHPQLLNES